MPLRSVKMNRFIFGFQRRVWCPKWTPLSSSWRMVTTAMVGCSLFSLVVTPTGGGRPGARSPATVGPEEDRDQGGPPPPVTWRFPAEGTRGRPHVAVAEHQAYARLFRPLRGLRPGARSNPLGGTPRAGAASSHGLSCRPARW